MQLENVTKIFGQPTAKWHQTPHERIGNNWSKNINHPQRWKPWTHWHHHWRCQVPNNNRRHSFCHTSQPRTLPKDCSKCINRKKAKEEAEQKDSKQQNNIFCRVEQGMKDEILKAVDNNYLFEIENKMLGHLNQKPKQMLTHLKNRGDQLDYADTKKLLVDCNSEWTSSKFQRHWMT